MQELMVSHNEGMEKIDEFSENLDRDVARLDDVWLRLDETMQRIADVEDAKEKFRPDEEEEEKIRRRLYE